MGEGDGGICTNSKHTLKRKHNAVAFTHSTDDDLILKSLWMLKHPRNQELGIYAATQRKQDYQYH